LLYIAPRPTDFFPYDAAGYAAYKRDIAALARQTGATLANIEDAVPNRYWGMVDLAFGFPVRDPFHFRAEGHALTAKALVPLIESHLLGGPAR
jgi:lysophospholipase L1-like esterase